MNERYGLLDETQYGAAPSGRILRIIATATGVAHGWQIHALSGRQQLAAPRRGNKPPTHGNALGINNI